MAQDLEEALSPYRLSQIGDTGVPASLRASAATTNVPPVPPLVLDCWHPLCTCRLMDSLIHLGHFTPALFRARKTRLHIKILQQERVCWAGEIRDPLSMWHRSPSVFFPPPCSMPCPAAAPYAFPPQHFCAPVSASTLMRGVHKWSSTLPAEKLCLSFAALSCHSPSPSPGSDKQVDLGCIYYLQCLWRRGPKGCSTLCGWEAGEVVGIFHLSSFLDTSNLLHVHWMMFLLWLGCLISGQISLFPSGQDFQAEEKDVS